MQVGGPGGVGGAGPMYGPTGGATLAELRNEWHSMCQQFGDRYGQPHIMDTSTTPPSFHYADPAVDKAYQKFSEITDTLNRLKNDGELQTWLSTHNFGPNASTQDLGK